MTMKWIIDVRNTEFVISRVTEKPNFRFSVTRKRGDPPKLYFWCTNGKMYVSSFLLIGLREIQAYFTWNLWDYLHSRIPCVTKKPKFGFFVTRWMLIQLHPVCDSNIKPIATKSRKFTGNVYRYSIYKWEHN